MQCHFLSDSICCNSFLFKDEWHCDSLGFFLQTPADVRRPVYYAEVGDTYFANGAWVIRQEQSVREGVRFSLKVPFFVFDPFSPSTGQKSQIHFHQSKIYHWPKRMFSQVLKLQNQIRNTSQLTNFHLFYGHVTWSLISPSFWSSFHNSWVSLPIFVKIVPV